MTSNTTRTSAFHAVLAILAATALVAGSASAQGVVLYGTAHGPMGTTATSDLYVIDPATAEATLVGPIDDPGFPGQIRNVTGLAFLDDGVLVGAANGDLLPDCVAPSTRCSALVEIDPLTAAATLIGLIGGNEVADQCGRATDLTYDPTGSTLFAWGGRCLDTTPNSDQLLTVDLATGLGTEVGETGFFAEGNGLAREPSTGTLFAATGSDLATLDSATGAGTVVPGSAPLPQTVSGLDFDPDSGVLYGAEIDGTLVTIDTATGAVSVVGQAMAGGGALDAFHGLAFQEVPEPADALLLVTGALLLVGAHQLRRGARSQA